MSEAQIEVTDKEGRVILLKGRYYEILKLFSQGLIKKQVGDALGLSAGTVNTYTSRLYRKLGVCNRSEAVVLFTRAQCSRDAGARG